MHVSIFLLLIVALLLLCGIAFAQEPLSYADVLIQNTHELMGKQDISVPLLGFTAHGTSIQTETIEDEAVLRWSSGEEGSLTFIVEVPYAGLYNLRVRYAQVDDRSGHIERSLSINGLTPFKECENIYFPKRFTDLQFPFIKNEFGNDVMPGMEGVEELGEMFFRDRDEFYAEPLKFLFQAGQNTLTLSGIQGGLLLGGITLTAPESIPSYGEYAAMQSETEVSSVIILEAEENQFRSNKRIKPASVSEPGVTPLAAGFKYLNTLGGDRWNTPGDYAQWRFNVRETGVYRLAFRYRQSFNPAMTSFRRVEIDGHTPFKELLAVPFEFGAGWQTKTLGDKDPYLFYLESGEHTLRMTSINAPYRSLYQRVSLVVRDMKILDLAIRETIGTDSDVYRIWRLERYIPAIAESLGDMAAEMQIVTGQLRDILGISESPGSLSAAISDLSRLAEDHNQIAKNTSSLSDIYTVFSDFTENMRSQPLQVDKIYLYTPQAELPQEDPGFAERLGFWFSNFIHSFFDQGDNLAVRQDEETVTVWVQRSRDYVDMMQLLADQYYTSETGVKVRVSYCPSGAQVLVLANSSGNQPDIVTGVDITLPFEFGIRNSLVDLSKFDSFGELVSDIPQGARIPYYFSDAEYAIAEEVKVKVIFYRKDILERLDIPLPVTWGDFTQALSTLLQNNYSLFYPYGDYLTFLFQNDVNVYTKDGLGLAFTSEKGFAAFKQWVDLYLRYGLQPEMSSFYQHFRTGDVPLGIADIDQYIQFEMAATDISGRWGIAPVPGTYNDAGLLKLWQAGSQSGAVIFKTNPEREERAWDFLNWWLSTDTQAMYADDMESYYGPEFRWFSANLRVIQSQAWPENAKKVLLEQMLWYKQLPMVPGGSYMTSRELWNAWTRIVIDKGNYRTEIERAVEDIQLELSIKQQELGYIDGKGKPLVPMDLMDISAPIVKGAE